jgi:chorismate mutase
MSKIELNIEPIESWAGTKPLIIAGPCSAESEEQVMATAKEIAQDKRVTYYRAGVWKPRTRPGTFEGHGQPALDWLKIVKQEYGLKTTCEVANPEHVEMALKSGIDMLWIGARTSVNPFSVQAIADAVKGTDIPVLVKNPINPDIELWIGALERMNKAGITKLASIHRGFSSFEKTAFRNAPMWDLTVQMRAKVANVPIINDPSHIAGNRDLLPFVCQKALDMNMDGLMIETHINPLAAWSDAAQQVTPKRLSEMLDELIVRSSDVKDPIVKSHLSELRHIIDNLDEDILQKISARMQVATKIGQYKKDNNITILQQGRWEDIIAKRAAFGDALGLGEDFMKSFLKDIHKESIRRQNEVMNK